MPPVQITRGKENIMLAPNTRTSFLPTPNAGSKGLPTSRVRCHNCLASGHTSTACPLRFCARCNLYGHTRRQCTRQKSGQRQWQRAVQHPPDAAGRVCDDEEPLSATATPPYDVTDPRNSVDVLIRTLTHEAVEE